MPSHTKAERKKVIRAGIGKKVKSKETKSKKRGK